MGVLDEQRTAMNGDRTPSKADDRTEQTVHLLNQTEKIEALEKKAETVILGTPPVKLTILPMTPAQMLVAWPLIRKIAGPFFKVMAAVQAGQSADAFAVFFDALGDDISFLPDLIWLIIKRGNDMTITRQWVDDNFDFGPDLAAILPIFVRQNYLAKLFMGKQMPQLAQSLSASGGNQNVEEINQPSTQTAE